MSTWENIPRLEGAPSIEYNEATVEYSDENYNYNGQVKENWSNEPKN